MADANKAAASVAGRLREGHMPADLAGLHRLPDTDRLARARAWTGYRAEVVTTRRPDGHHYVYTGQILAVAMMRQNSQTGACIVVADPDYRDPTVLSLAVVDSIRKALP